MQRIEATQQNCFERCYSQWKKRLKLQMQKALEFKCLKIEKKCRNNQSSINLSLLENSLFTSVIFTFLHRL